MGQIYETHFDFVWRNARRLGVPEASADDVVQDVFMIVHRRIADFDGRATIQASIFGILIRVARDHRRRVRRKGTRTVSFEQDSSHQAEVQPGPTSVELVERAERLRFLEKLLAELDEDKRTLLPSAREASARCRRPYAEETSALWRDARLASMAASAPASCLSTRARSSR